MITQLKVAEVHTHNVVYPTQMLCRTLAETAINVSPVHQVVNKSFTSHHPVLNDLEINQSYQSTSIIMPRASAVGTEYSTVKAGF